MSLDGPWLPGGASVSAMLATHAIADISLCAAFAPPRRGVGPRVSNRRVHVGWWSIETYVSHLVLRVRLSLQVLSVVPPAEPPDQELQQEP